MIAFSEIRMLAVAGLVAGGMVLAVPPMARANEPVELITAAEALLPPSASDGIDRNITRGPGVDAVAPSPVGVTGNFRLAVKFKPRNGVKIDPKDVRVTYLREPNIDLTGRLKDFISEDGIDAPDVIAPSGEHVIRIEVLDREGRSGRGQITLTVNAKP